MGKSLGLVEVIGLSTAVEVSDAMVKAAVIELADLEITKGSGMVTVKVQGNVGAVQASVATGKAVAQSYGAFVSAQVISRPLHSTVIAFVKRDTVAPKAEFYKEQVTTVTKLGEENQSLENEVVMEPTSLQAGPVDINEKKMEQEPNQVKVVPKKSFKNKGDKSKK